MKTEAETELYSIKILIIVFVALVLFYDRLGPGGIW